LLLFSACLRASAKNYKEDARPFKTGFVKIFNGKDLTGWDGEPGYWSVDDGYIIARVKPEVRVKNHTYLIWQGGKVRDFELRIKFRSTQGNSGIDYRAEPVLTGRDGGKLKWTLQGYQADVAKGWMGSLYNWGKAGAQPGQFVVVTGDDAVNKNIGSVADKQVLSDVGYYKTDDWNEFIIIARGSHITQRINDYLVVEFIDNSFQRRRDGLLGLQVHTGTGPFLNEFKDIRIRPFNTIFGQAKLLFNGRDLTNWSFSDTRTKNTWVVEEGVLTNRGGSQGYICTKDSYTNYVLRFQYRRSGSHKGSVMLRLAGSDRTEPKFIRLFGRDDDFNRIGTEGFTPKVRKRNTPAFRKLPDKLWNECEVVLNQGRLMVKVNGVLRATATECEQMPGKIGFNTDGSQIQYRNIVLIPILSS
jgi:hypothetical protein